MNLSRRRFLCQAGIAGVFAATAVSARPASAPRKPNVIYIMCDELGYFELSCMGNANIRTPNIDRMAAEGIRFTQALAGSSVCAPTRCCLMTGKHAGHTSVRTNGGGTPLRAGEETVASVLKKAGYATGGFGKWGCGGRGSTGVPEEHGFDVFFGYYDQVHAHSYYPPYLVRNSEEVPLPGNKGGSTGEIYSHYMIMEEGFNFVRAHKDRPFFCYFPITPPHGIFDIPDEDPAWQAVKDEPWPESVRRYAAMVGMVDRQVGELFDLLKSLSLDEDTVVFFCGDNGGADYFRDKEHPRGFHGANVDPKSGKQFRGHKGNLYEGGLRVPMIARWPGKIKPGQVSDLLWYFPDVLPTVAEIAGVASPDDIDGISVLPTLVGEGAAGRAQPRHKYLYWELGQQKAVRMGSWKAVCPRDKAKWELYDLSKDIEEADNVAEVHAGVLATMTAFAAEAHEPAVTGTFHNPAIHEKDRRAKFGGKMPDGHGSRVNAMPPKGLIPSKDWKVVRVSSESTFNGKLALCAFDGDPRTIWHSKWRDELKKHPHELVVDLGKEYSVRGFRYLPRQDGGWNGTMRECEFFVSDRPDAFGAAAVQTTFRKTREAQDAACKPVRGRYIMVRGLSEIGDGPWTTIAELGVLGE